MSTAFPVYCDELGGASFGAPVFIPVTMTTRETDRQLLKTYGKDVAMTSKCSYEKLLDYGTDPFDCLMVPVQYIIRSAVFIHPNSCFLILRQFDNG